MCRKRNNGMGLLIFEINKKYSIIKR